MIKTFLSINSLWKKTCLINKLLVRSDRTVMKIRYVVEKCPVSLWLIIFITFHLNKSPFDKTKGDKHNDRRDIYSPYRWNYTPDWLKNRFGYFIKECCRWMMWVVWDPCQDDPNDKHYFIKSYNFSNKSKFHRKYLKVKENLLAYKQTNTNNYYHSWQQKICLKLSKTEPQLFG